MELPKIYEPIESFKALEERLKYFLDQVMLIRIVFPNLGLRHPYMVQKYFGGTQS